MNTPSYAAASCASPPTLPYSVRRGTARRNGPHKRPNPPGGEERERSNYHDAGREDHATTMRSLDLIEGDRERLYLIGSSRLHTRGM